MGEVMGKRELKKIQARKKIMEAALQQFRENGFQTASVADIMKTAENCKINQQHLKFFEGELLIKFITFEN